MTDQSVTRLVRAPFATVYRALTDPDAVARWRAPDSMTATVHEWEPVVGGGFRVTLAYDDPASPGKSSRGEDTYHGTFIDLVVGSRVVERVEFESDDPQLRGVMTVTTTLTDAPDGTLVAVAFEDLPAGVAPEDNAAGAAMSLANLATLVEGG